MSKKMKLMIFIGAAIVIAAMVIINLKKAHGDVVEVQTGKVKRGDVVQLVTGSGRIQPQTEVDISAFVSAEITSIQVKEGDKVEPGQLLAELDRTRYEATLERAKSDLKSSKASLKKANSELKRAQQLFEKKLSSIADLEGAEADYELAESRVEQAEAGLKQVRDDLSKTRLVSPIAGTVARINKEKGEIALGSQFQADVVMMVADLTKMEMVAEIDENDVVLVSENDHAEIEIDAFPDEIFHGQVNKIAHTATTRGLGTLEEVTNFEVRILILDDVTQIRPGMSATVEIKTETHKNVLYVPIQAITTRETIDSTDTRGKISRKTWRRKKGSSNDANEALWGGSETNGTDSQENINDSKKDKAIQVVFVVEEGRAWMKPVDTGITGEKDVEIVRGLEEDQEIVTGSFRTLSNLLKENSRIKVNNKRKKFGTSED